MAKLLGLDIGDRRIGLALADDEDGYIVIKPALERTSDQAALTALADLVGAEGITRVVAGLPLGLSGARTAQTEAALAFVERLRSELGVPVETVDERLTTKLAHRLGRTHDDDSAAAALILTTALERKPLR